MAESFDFQINDLKFRAATSDRFPYARATAPFRKEQFDAAPTVGDQSLAGWWTRGQLSFHRGGGAKYYEVLEGDEVLNRYSDAEAVIPWTPGEVTLSRNPVVGATGGVLTPTDLWCNTPASLAWIPRGGGSYTYGIAGSEQYPPGTGAEPRVVAMWGNATPADMTTLGTRPRAVCASDTGDGLVFVAVDAKIEVFDTSVTGYDPATATSSILWTNTYSATSADNVFDSVFFAKGRLWAVDVAGNWFALSATAGGTLTSTSTEMFWASGIRHESWLEPTHWAFADSPGATFIGFGQYIYSVSLTDDGSGVPTVGPGVVVGDLGAGEEIRNMLHHRGLLAVNAIGGLRFCEVGNAGAALGVGPVVQKWPWNQDTISMAASGDLLFFAGQEESGSASLFMANMATLLEPLVPAITTYFHQATTPYGGNSSGQGGLAGGSVDGSWFQFFHRGASQGLRHDTAEVFCDSGYVLTGYHRFGTLDEKHFQLVEVRGTGDGGTISVYRVDADETETLLGVLDVAVSNSATFSTQLSAPVERIALKFVLAPVNETWKYTAPTLLGYQIKALPSPVRQRLIKWPLMIQDVVRDRYGVSRGTREGAWTAWSEIEALEESDALVTFTDHRTGETGEAYIETLELQTDTPTQGANSGFGGVGYVTLRKVS